MIIWSNNYQIINTWFADGASSGGISPILSSRRSTLTPLAQSLWSMPVVGPGSALRKASSSAWETLGWPNMDFQKKQSRINNRFQCITCNPLRAAVRVQPRPAHCGSSLLVVGLGCCRELSQLRSGLRPEWSGPTHSSNVLRRMSSVACGHKGHIGPDPPRHPGPRRAARAAGAAVTGCWRTNILVRINKLISIITNDHPLFDFKQSQIISLKTNERTSK